jgi:ProP effector
MRKQELHPRTAVLNKIQKNSSKKLREQALQWLTVNFPQAFDNSSCIRPLKIGIMEDIFQYADKAAAEGISKSKLREAVVIFTRRLEYLTCIKLREMRIDLLGTPINEVTEEESAHAAAKIKKRVEKSARNARNLLNNKISAPPTNQKTNSHPAQEQSNYFPIYPSRGTYAANQNSTPKASTVIVKHKTTRQYDPSAVARLKEKLGLYRAVEKEAID